MLSSLSAVLAALAAASTQSPSSEANEVLIAQILLDRAGHSPGVIDGKRGSNTSRALAAYERSNGLPVDGRIDPELMSQLQAAHAGEIFQTYTIQASDVNKLVDVPEGFTAQSKLEHLGYETALEALAEKFHMSQALVEQLNPGADLAPGSTIKVVRPAAGTLSTKVARIEVDKAAAEVRAFDAAGKLIASYPATVGSDDFPSPSGSMEVRAIAPTPKYYFNPEGRSWGPDQNLTIAAGPNNPVGSTWIDLSKEGYGIHGTPEPRLIGKTGSHGCVRLTNWDAEELAGAVEAGTEVIFI